MITREKIMRGPAIGSFNGLSFYTESDVTVTITSRTQPIEVAMFGQIDESDDDVMIEVSYTPSGEVTTDLLNLYLPFFQGTYYPGTPLFGATDLPLTLTTRSGERLTLKSAALTTPAPIAAVGTKKLFGAVKFTGLPANGSSWSTANRLFLYETNITYPGDAGFAPASIIRQPFMGKWFSGILPTGSVSGSGASPDIFSDAADHGLIAGDTICQSGFTDTALNGTFTIATVPTTKEYTLYQLGTTTPLNGSGSGETGGSYKRANIGDSFNCFDTEAGFAITPQVSLTPDKTDNGGTINMIFQKATVTAKAIPVGPGVPDLLTLIGLQGSGAVRGRSLAGRARPLYLSGAGLYVKLPLAALTSENIRFGVNPKRLGELQWNSEMSFVDNAPVPLLEVSTTPIS